VITLRLILLIIALVCLLLRAFSVTPARGPELGWLGLALWLLAITVS
jgi:hypothetical protein